MSAKTEPFWKQVSVQVVSGLVLLLIPAGIALLFEPVRAFIAACWAGLLADVAVPLWWVLVLWAVFLLSILTLLVRLARAMRTPQVPGPFEQYFQDTFEGMRWQWSYSREGRVVGLTPLCLTCERNIRYSEERSYGHTRAQVFCQACQWDSEYRHDYEELLKQISLEIVHRIRTGLWKEVVLGEVDRKIRP